MQLLFSSREKHPSKFIEGYTSLFLQSNSVWMPENQHKDAGRWAVSNYYKHWESPWNLTFLWWDLQHYIQVQNPQTSNTAEVSLHS